MGPRGPHRAGLYMLVGEHCFFLFFENGNRLIRLQKKERYKRENAGAILGIQGFYETQQPKKEEEAKKPHPKTK